MSRRRLIAEVAAGVAITAILVVVAFNAMGMNVGRFAAIVAVSCLAAGAEVRIRIAARRWLGQRW